MKGRKGECTGVFESCFPSQSTRGACFIRVRSIFEPHSDQSEGQARIITLHLNISDQSTDGQVITLSVGEGF